MSMNRAIVANNKYQGDFKRVLCVCSGGILRSPTAAFVLASSPYNYNTRACGLTLDFALIPIDDVLVEWAQEIVVMEPWMATGLRERKPVICLDIPDNYEYRNPELIKLITERYNPCL